MKLRYKIFILLFPTALFGQVQKFTTIEINVKKCDREEGFFYYNDTISLVKLSKDTVEFKLPIQKYRGLPIQIKNIPVAEYKLTYTSNFKQKIEKKISLIDKNTNEIFICPDSLLEYPQNTLFKLKDKEKIEILFESQGCFHESQSKIILIKVKDKFIAELHEFKSYKLIKKPYIHKKGIGDTILKKIVMTELNIQDFIRFENELNYANRGSCTTIDKYEIKSKYLKWIVVDASCSWRGYKYLTKSFFGDLKE